MTTLLADRLAFAPQAPPAASVLTERLVTAVDADAATLRASLAGLDLSRVAVGRFGSFGTGMTAPVVDAPACGALLHVAWPIDHEAPAPIVDGELGPGAIRVTWEIDINPTGAGASFVSVGMRFAAGDDAARRRLLDGWSGVRTLSYAVARGVVAAVAAAADDDEELAA
jgi:hypothetical protein